MSSLKWRLFGELDAQLKKKDARAVLFERSTSFDQEIRETTARIIANVRAFGDAELRRQALEYNGIELEELEVAPRRVAQAIDSVPTGLRRAMERAATNITVAHEAQLPQAHEVETEPGIQIIHRPDPLRIVGVYAPGGRATYPSSVLMGAIPARVAGVRDIILCSPPGLGGEPSVAVLAAAHLAGVSRVFAVGGAGAIAAMAVGTDTVPRVQRVVGPGNAYVAEAKLQLAGSIAFDSPAGPSELLVLAGEGAYPANIARELLAQAEHDPQATIVCVCSSRDMAVEIREAMNERALKEPRHAIITQCLANHGALLWCESMDAAVSFANDFAPEHLFISATEGRRLMAGIRNAGTVFLGESSSVVFGDYMTGANHVLPTGSLARSYSGLSTLDFMRWTTFQIVQPEAAQRLATDVAIFAEAESLPAHAAAARTWKDSA